MRRWIAAMLTLASHMTFANGLTISVPALKGQNASANTVNVAFDISWSNSWRRSDAPANWDAAWIFVKYRVGTGPWQHATLSTTGHVAPSGSTISTPSDGKGAFIMRSSNGTGSVNFSGVKLQWNYGTDGVGDNDAVTVKVFGIEMVYVPTDSYYLGSGGQEPGTFTDGVWVSGNTDPFLISSENAIPVGQTAGQLWATLSRGGDDIGPTTPIPAAFPKGYQHFYMMKYPVTQEQYVDFLNALTYTQQASRTFAAPNAPARTKAMMEATWRKDRNAIQIVTPGTASSIPAVYGCDLDSNGVFNQSHDGQTVSANWLSWADGIAYTDWAGLRPMTEMEFEKASRGPLASFQYERPYGNTVVAHLMNVLNGGQADERYVAAAAPLEHSWNDSLRGAANINAGGVQHGFLDYPVRVGIFATDTSGRVESGASYYGIMDLAGDLWERVVSVGTLTGRAFTGTHGDGSLNSSGDMTGNSDWPGTNAVGSGFRGGNYTYDSDWAMTSDRDLATHEVALRYETQSKTYGAYTVPGFRGTFGFRSVRSAP